MVSALANISLTETGYPGEMENFNGNWVAFSQGEISLGIHSGKFVYHVVLSNSFRMSNEWWVAAASCSEAADGSASLESLAALSQ